MSITLASAWFLNVGSFFLGGSWHLPTVLLCFCCGMAFPITSPFLRAFQHRNWAGFPAAFQPIQSFEGVREPVSSKCLSPCQSKPWGQGWLSIHTSALGVHTLMALQAWSVPVRKQADSLPGTWFTLWPRHCLMFKHSQFVHCLSPSPYGLIPLRAPYSGLYRMLAWKPFFSNVLENAFLLLCLSVKTGGGSYLSLPPKGTTGFWNLIKFFPALAPQPCNSQWSWAFSVHTLQQQR